VNTLRIETTAELAAAVDELVDQWCERRSLRALRQILVAWPSPLRLTDDWGQLREALRNVLAFARPELSSDEIGAVEEAITAIDVAMNQASSGAVRR
jgi:hypothetical protein